MTRHLLSLEVATPKANDRYRYDGQATYLAGPVTTAPDGLPGFAAGTYRIFYDAESFGEEYGFEFVVGESGDLRIGDPLKRDPTDENYTPVPDLRTVVRQGGETGEPILTGGYLTYNFPEVLQAVHVLVDDPVERNGQTVHQIARLPVERLLSPNPGTARPVWAHRALSQQVALPVESLLVWARRSLSQQVAVSTPTAPAAPSLVRATRTPGTRNAVLSWVDNANNETGYVVEQSPNGSSSWTPLYDADPNITVLPLSGLSLNTDYYYRVKAVNGVDSSAWAYSPKLRLTDFLVTFGVYGQGNPPTLIRQLLAGATSVTPGVGNIGALVTLPGGSAPTGADYDAVSLEVIFPGNVKHGWNYPDGLAQAGAYFSDPRPNGATIPAGTISITFTIYKDNQAIQVDRLSYTFSAPVSAPNAPTELTAVRNSTGTGVTLTYRDNSNNEDSFTIEFQPPGSDWKNLDSVVANTTSKTILISPLPDNTKFRVRGVNSGGSSDWAEATLYTPNPLTIDRVRARVIRDVPASAGLFLEIGVTIDGEPIDIQLTTSAGVALGPWQGPNYGSGAPGALGDDGSYVHTIPYNANTQGATTLYFRVRPTNNPTAVRGLYAAAYGGNVTYNWLTLTPNV